MSVLTLSGGKIDWNKPPKPTDRVKWSNRTSGGKPVIGSFRTICWLEQQHGRAQRKYGTGVVVIQAPYNTTVAASAGTHDYDACLDVYIPGVGWEDQQTFFRKGGAGAYWRRPPKFGNHIHLFVLPPREGKNVSDDYASGGFKVGKFVDGGYSLYGYKAYSSQIEDYYAHRDALAGHRPDPSWFPPNIIETIFDLNSYVKAQQALSNRPAPPKPSGKSAILRFASNNVMSLPKNPEAKKTILSTPGASVLMLQEMDLPAFHNLLKNLPVYETGSVPAGNQFGAFVAYKPTDWAHVSTKFVKQYDGVGGISYTRHIAVTELRHKALGKNFGFISYHSVTAGNDANRRRMRREGDAAVRAEVAKFKARGIPVVVGADMNRRGKGFGSATLWIHHILDHLYLWNGKGVTFRKNSQHTVKTRSDHDAVVVEVTVTVK